MYRRAEKYLNRLQQTAQLGALRGGKKGIERETLRVGPDGGISQAPHPRALGSALTHPYITTDYSEALLEFITPPHTDLGEMLACLRGIHQYTYAQLNDGERLWTASMPCVVAGDASIPIARYGTSNVGTMKHVYRRGLGHRYGRVMQAISGVHFNYSLPPAFWPAFCELEGCGDASQDFVSAAYFSLLRNFQRHAWLLLYLFGSSPAVCKSFFDSDPDRFDSFDAGTAYEPFGTSLRMSDLGYQNKSPEELAVSCNSLDEYVADLWRAIETPYPAYEQIGVVVDGEYRQLNANILQIENEYYGVIRPKQITNSGEKPTVALHRRGVEYVEVRALDVDDFSPVGIGESAPRFIEALLVLCTLAESPAVGAAEQSEIDANLLAVAHRGRTPNLKLQRNGKHIALRDWGEEVIEALQGICEALDDDGTTLYADTLREHAEAVRDPDRTQSARVLAEMRAQKETFFHFALRKSDEHRAHFENAPVDEAQMEQLAKASRESLARQAEIEAADDVSFDEYLARYFAQSLDEPN